MTQWFWIALLPLPLIPMLSLLSAAIKLSKQTAVALQFAISHDIMAVFLLYYIPHTFNSMSLAAVMVPAAIQCHRGC